MFINAPGENGAIETFKSACSERVAMIICVLGIILVGIVSCIYAWLNSAAETSISMYL